MSARQRLPNRRLCESFQLEHAGLGYTVSFSRFLDGGIGELFIQNHKRSGGADIAAVDAGIVVSLLLQYGCDAQTIAQSLSRNSDGTATGVVGAALDRILGDGR
jgi:hypothetical protein